MVIPAKLLVTFLIFYHKGKTMTSDLQSLAFDETQDALSVEVKLRITGKNVDVHKIKQCIKVTPTQAWMIGDEYLGKQLNEVTKKREIVYRNRKENLWELSTKKYTQSLRVDEHIAIVWELLGDNLSDLPSLKGNDGCVSLTVVKNTMNEVIDYEMKPDLFVKILTYCDKLIFVNNHSQSNEDCI